jgi:stage II sporulation protein D
MDEREFILYTVAAEMPVSYGAEALKAQAVASYTYYCYQREQERLSPTVDLHGADFADVPSDFPENYNKEAWRKRWGAQFDTHYKALESAVDSVFGTTIRYDGELVMAAYHALSCGQTESAKNVWNTELPYLQSVPSTGDALADDFTTTVTFTPAALAAALVDVPHIQLSGDAAGWLGETARSDAGTVTSQIIGGVALSGRELRKLLALRSAAFHIDYKHETFVFTVQGYGHGVGMSQYGAGYLARQGMRYDEILRYYYTGITLQTD